MYNRLKKNQMPNASIYEAVGKMLLGNAVGGQKVNPALGLISQATGLVDDQEYNELLEKPLWQLTGKDHANIVRHVLIENFSSREMEPPSQKRYVYVYKGIAELFNCSRSTAQRLKLSGIIDDAVTQLNRKIIVEADLALQLVKESGKKVNEL